jgi:hypothetical protein
LSESPSPAKSLALVVDTSIGGRRLARELDALIARRGKRAIAVSATSYVGKKSPLEASDHGASERPDTLRRFAQAGSAIKKWSLP